MCPNCECDDCAEEARRDQEVRDRINFVKVKYGAKGPLEIMAALRKEYGPVEFVWNKAEPSDVTPA